MCMGRQVDVRARALLGVGLSCHLFPHASLCCGLCPRCPMLCAAALCCSMVQVVSLSHSRLRLLDLENCGAVFEVWLGGAGGGGDAGTGKSTVASMSRKSAAGGGKSGGGVQGWHEARPVVVLRGCRALGEGAKVALRRAILGD